MIYIPVRVKFIISILVSLSWLLICFKLSIPWMYDLSRYMPVFIAALIIFSIALLPGFMYMFLLISYLLDYRQAGIELVSYPPVTILVAAYNEQDSIVDTLRAISLQDYPATIHIFLLDDGSTDATRVLAEQMNLSHLTIFTFNRGGKAMALNQGLAHVNDKYVITIDADTYLARNAVREIVKKLLSGPLNTVACAGSVYVKNSRKNWITKVQEWDYFHSIAVIKRTQSLFQGTLVAQGAFSIYKKTTLQEVGGWPNVVGEDIVLTWAMLAKGYRIDFAEQAISFTNVPDTYRQFFYQRSRWARGLVEAFISHPLILFKKRMTTFYIYWNMAFILMDSIFFLVFLPGLIAALFGYFFIAGPMTLAVIPLGAISNFIFYRGQKEVFHKSKFKVRKNIKGFILFMLFYQILMNPAVIHGYVSEFLRRKKKWGTK